MPKVSTCGGSPEVTTTVETRHFAADAAKRHREPQSWVDQTSCETRLGRETWVVFAEGMMPEEELRDLREQGEHWRLLATQISDRRVLEAVMTRLYHIETRIAQLEAEICQHARTQNERSVNQPPAAMTTARRARYGPGGSVDYQAGPVYQSAEVVQPAEVRRRFG
jgi:hypothetical protein